LALARRFPAVGFVGMDASGAALEQARANAAAAGITNAMFMVGSAGRGWTWAPSMRCYAWACSITWPIPIAPRLVDLTAPGRVVLWLYESRPGSHRQSEFIQAVVDDPGAAPHLRAPSWPRSGTGSPGTGSAR
jgi:hypothetical protein